MKRQKAIKHVIILILLIISNYGFSQNQSEKILVEGKSGDTVLVQNVSEEFVRDELKKGIFTIGVGGRYKTNIDKNYEYFSSYVLEKKDKDLFLRLAISYFIKDKNSLGIFTSYSNFKSDYNYVTVVGDTVQNHTTESDFRGGFFFKKHNSLFDSKRIFWISQVELGISLATKMDYTYVIEKREQTSKNEILSTNLLLRFGLLLFPFKKFSIEGSLAAVGIGYESQKFYTDDQPNGSSGDFFIAFTPDFFTLQFKITSYF